MVLGAPLVLVVDNRPSVRLFLTAVFKSLGRDFRVIAVGKLAEARRELKREFVRMVVLGLEKYEPEKKNSFLQYLSTAFPETSAVLVYDSEHSVKGANGVWITEAWPNFAYHHSILDAESCRSVFLRALNSGSSPGKIK